jgi:NADH-quinone oxidoreductase subunit N
VSAPLLWIVLPGLLAIFLFSIRRWTRLMHFLGILIALILAWLAWQIPFNEAIHLGAGFNPLIIDESFMILGRQFILNDALRPALLMIYLGSAVWFGGAYVAGVSRIFVPLGLAISALLTASLSVSPTLYSVIILEFVAIISIPILSPPGKPVSQGVLRFISYMTIGICLILFGEWLLPVTETASGDSLPWLRASIMLTLGFAMVGAVFPFHTWALMAAEHSHPYGNAFLFYILPVTITILMLGTINRFISAGAPSLMMAILQIAGVMMIVGGGLIAAFEGHLGRIMGFAMLVQTGISLMILSLSGRTTEGLLSIGLLFAQRIPQGIALAVWGLALTALQSQVKDLSYHSVQGLARRMPLACASLVLSNLSMAGIPFLASFPINFALGSILAGLSPLLLWACLAGNGFLLVAGLRTLAVLAMNPEATPWRMDENRLTRIFLVLGWVVIFVVGLMPQRFFPYLVGIAQIFHNPIP